jgi:mersacidin/lichenicidin family type 2 lantibiotic
MSNVDIVRAWKDAAYRESLTEEQRALVPANPAGIIELTDDELGSISGGVAAIVEAGGTGTGGGSCICSSTGTGSGQSCNCSC